MTISEPPWYIALLIDPVVFDVDSMLRQIEIRLVLPEFCRSGRVLVVGFILVFEAVEIKEVCYPDLFKAFAVLPFECSLPVVGHLDIL